MYLTIILLPLLASIASGFSGRKIGVSGSHLITCTSGFFWRNLVLNIFSYLAVEENQSSIYVLLVLCCLEYYIYYFYNLFLNTVYNINDLLSFNLFRGLFLYFFILGVILVTVDIFILTTFIILSISCILLCIFHLNFKRFKSKHPIISLIIYITLFLSIFICLLIISYYYLNLIFSYLRQFIVKMENYSNNSNESKNTTSKNNNNSNNNKNSNNDNPHSNLETKEERKKRMSRERSARTRARLRGDRPMRQRKKYNNDEERNNDQDRKTKKLEYNRKYSKEYNKLHRAEYRASERGKMVEKKYEEARKEKRKCVKKANILLDLVNEA